MAQLLNVETGVGGGEEGNGEEGNKRSPETRERSRSCDDSRDVLSLHRVMSQKDSDSQKVMRRLSLSKYGEEIPWQEAYRNHETPPHHRGLPHLIRKGMENGRALRPSPSRVIAPSPMKVTLPDVPLDSPPHLAEGEGSEREGSSEEDTSDSEDEGESNVFISPPPMVCVPGESFELTAPAIDYPNLDADSLMDTSHGKTDLSPVRSQRTTKPHIRLENKPMHYLLHDEKPSMEKPRLDGTKRVLSPKERAARGKGTKRFMKPIFVNGAGFVDADSAGCELFFAPAAWLRSKFRSYSAVA